MARTDILERKEDILLWIKENLPKAEIARRLRCKIDTLNTYLLKMGIEYSGNKGRKGTPRSTEENYIPASNYFYKNSPISSSKLRLKILREGLKPHKCEKCNLSEWSGVPIPLELEHIDGDHYNNEWDNLALLCPNCHALTPTHSGKNVGRYTG
ncbi:homing endonuclease [Salmonella phage Kenya-K16]|nr:homing endonuclease [Salmonella phage Kenya-K16]